ncbi:DUF3103 family protein [Streptomyces avermitilis]|uniref:DUF3103 family protein n=1 Tax=Streptomyces avermitilis TaxID=33903 RepID=UPI003822A37D
MRTKRKRNNVLIALMLTAMISGTAQTGVSIATENTQNQPAAFPSHSVLSVEDTVARSLAASLSQPEWRAQVREASLATDEVDLQKLMGETDSSARQELLSSVTDANQRLATLKGLPSSVGSLLRIRLGASSMRAQLQPGVTPWVAVTTSDERAETITAYDSQGHRHLLDATQVPASPVYVVDLDASKAHATGLRVLRNELADSGLSVQQSKAERARSAGGWWGTKVTSVEVNDDQEPWYKGDAEMFSLVTGFGQDGKARVDSVDMPYLDSGSTVYYPNQILVNWSLYKYNLADVVMMEDDDGTNYKALAQALTTALLTITDQGAYTSLANALLSAIPDSWFNDDPDYVESWYTLSKNAAGRLNGAAGNAWMAVEPYFVEEL